MNTARFLFCVNSDDPDIVAQGLEEFRTQVLKDHGATESYGYHGRGSYEDIRGCFHPEKVVSTVGVLASFIRSSPLLEELFILWGLPGRDDDKPLSSSHMACLAVILHVAQSNISFCSTIVNRILHEHAKSIVSQLSCGNIRLVHSTLALVLAMCRSSPQNCRDTFQKLIPISVSTFATLLQQGKTVIWEASKSDDSTESFKLKTDSRLLLIIIILIAIESADQSTGPELFSSSTSLLKRITNAINKDNTFTIQFILESLIFVRKQPNCEQQMGSKLVDIRFQDNLLSLYHNDDVKLVKSVHSFLLDHSHHLVSSMSKGRGVAAGNSKATALQLLRSLEGHRDLNHREIQMVLLKAQPSLLAKSISSVALATWEPVATVQYYCALSQLTFLCGTVDVDSQFKSAMKALVLSVTGEGVTERDVLKADATIRGLTSGFVQAMIPLSFQKKDISKLLQHKNALLQRSGLLYILAVMQRLLKALNAASSVGVGRVVKIENAVAATVHKLLPDFQLLLNIRSKYSKLVAETEPEKSAMETETTDERQKTLYLLSLLLRVIECYVKSVPSLVSQAGFELTRLIDEVVPWGGKDTAQSAVASIGLRIGMISTVLGPVIRALRHATSSRQCKWFGNVDDCGKLITHLVVMSDWDMQVKRTPLAKLLLLVVCKELEEADNELYMSVCQLVRAVLKQSGMYQGHGVVDLELRTEQAAWLDALSYKDNSILILDATLRMAYHWNTEYCIESANCVSKHTHGAGYQSDEVMAKSSQNISVVVPFSPVMSCAIKLCSNNLNIISTHLPRHIRVHIDPQPHQNDPKNDPNILPSSPTGSNTNSSNTTETSSEVTNPSLLLSKYSSGFRAELQRLLLDVVLTSGLKARSAGSYGQCVLAVADAVSALSDSESTIYEEITEMSALLSSMSSVSNVSGSINNSVNSTANSSVKTPAKTPSKSKVTQDPTVGFQDLIRGIALEEDSDSVQLIRSVLTKAEGLSSKTPGKTPAKRARVETNIVTAENSSDSTGSSTIGKKLSLHSAVIGFVVQNMDRIVSCYPGLLSKDSEGIDEETKVSLKLIDSICFFSAGLYCNYSTVQGQLGASFCQWVAALATRELNRSRGSGGHSELESKATVIVQAVRLLRLLSSKYIPVAVGVVKGKDVAPLGRRGRSASTDESHTNINTAINEAASALTSLVVELIRQTSCAPLVADALNSTELLDGMPQRDLYGTKSRQILCAAASAYYRRFNTRSKKGTELQGGVEDVTLELWKEVAERLLKMQATVKGNVSAQGTRIHTATHILPENNDSDIFSLGWMIQHFVDNQLLRSQFIDLALRDGQGHSLLDLNMKLNVAQASSSFALIPLDAVSVSVLQSASIQTLAGALKSFIYLDTPKSVPAESVISSGEDSMKVTDHAITVVKSVTGNALCCAVIGLGSSPDSPFPHINSFISPLSLMQISLKNSATASKTTAPATTATSAVTGKVYQITPLCPSLSRDSKESEFLSVTLPLCVGREDMSLMDTVRVFREFQVLTAEESSGNGYTMRETLLLAIAGSVSGASGGRAVSSVCKLLSHPSVVGSSYTLRLLASYVQSQLTPADMNRFLKGSFSAVAICSSLPDVLRIVNESENVDRMEGAEEEGEGEGEGSLLTSWYDSYHTFLCDLLDTFTVYLASLESLGNITTEISQQITSYFSLLQPLIMISMTAAYNGQDKVDNIVENLKSKAPEIRKKLNKWIKSCLKFGLHSSAVVSGLSDFYSATRGYFLGTISANERGNISLWGEIYAAKVMDFYHPSLILQMVVSHSKFTATLRGGKQVTNISLLKFLLVLLSISLPISNINESDISLGETKNNQGTVADQFFVSVLLMTYQGTMSDSDRLVLRILHLLNDADKCPALCTLKPITLNSKKSHNITPTGQTGGPIFNTILQQLVYTTLSQYPTWRTITPQPMLSEGPEAEKLHRQQFSSLIGDVTQDWSGEEKEEKEGKEGRANEKEGKGGRGGRGDVDYDSDIGSGSEGSDDDSDGEGGEGGEGGDDQSDMDSILSIVSDKNKAEEWSCEDGDTYVPSIDSLTVSVDKVYDPCFWIPALHHTLMQQPHSVRQLANTGALSLVIAGISSRCPILRTISISSLQRILELLRLQTPDKDAGFRERPQLLLLLNFVRNALDSFAPSSSGPTQFPSVISLFLSRAALHLLQPTHELYSKINKYLLSRPFCDFKDVPLYDLLLVDGDAQTEQASRLTTFRIVRDGLCTRWDHLNLCRKNAYNRLMLLFPVLSKDTRAGHAVFDLLDKALGMQVSARYLLERCSVVSWLQQMASTTNSLDIDTTHSAHSAHTRRTDTTHTTRTKTTQDLTENAEDDEENEVKGKGGRNTVIRSQPSVLLAAPPRLLARVLCLMRRALGASYLLSAGSSTSSSLHLDEIQLAISTLIDDVLAVDSVGMTSEIPFEFFRQLVLLMWDYALASSGEGEGKSMSWGVDRVHFLALAIQHSARSGVSQSVDDMVISLLSLLSFQTSCSLQGSGNVRYVEVRDMLAGCALKNLVLPLGDKHVGDAFAISQSQSQSTVNKGVTGEDATAYHSVVNSLSQDNSKRKISREIEGIWSVNMTQGPSGSWERIEETNGTDISLLIHESWEQLAQTGYEAMSLPVTMGKKVMLCMSVKGILNVAIMNCRNSGPSSSIPSIPTVPLFSLETARWALLIKSAFLRPSVSALNLSLSTGGSSVLMRRVLSSSDHSSLHAYTISFCDFQLSYRLTVLTTASILDHSVTRERSKDETEIYTALHIILCCLLRITVNNGDSMSSESIFQSLNSKGKNDTVTVPDGSFFWEMDSIQNNGTSSPRCLVQEVCNLALEISAGLVSAIDRNSAAQEATGVHTANVHGNDITIFERLIVEDVRYVVTLCKALNAAASPISISIPTHNPSILSVNFFESMPGKDKNLSAAGAGGVSGVGAKRSIVLFDRTSAVWRMGGLGSRDRVLASMRAVQYAPLAGVQSRFGGYDEGGSDGDEETNWTDGDMGEEGEDEEDAANDDEDFSPLGDNNVGDEMDWEPASDAEEDNEGEDSGDDDEVDSD